MAPSGGVCLCCVCVHRNICLTGSHISETETITMLHVLRLFNKRTHHLCDQNKLNCAQQTGCVWLFKEFDIRRSLSSDRFNGSSMPFSHENGSHVQGSLPPYDKRPYCWPTSLTASLLLTLHSTSFCPPSAFSWIFKKRGFAWGGICHLFSKTKTWNALCMFFFFFPPSFCPLSICIFVACSIVESLHPTQASVPSVCPRGERTGRARLD